MGGYDLLGYTVPGLTFLVMASFRWYLQIPVEKLEQYSNYEGYIGVGFFVCSYICGIAISEIARFFLESVFQKKKWFCSETCMSDLGKKLGMDSIRKALQKSGLITKDISQNQISDEYIQLMYSDIQTDTNYKRIHNYASAEVMYKNMTFALFFGSASAFLISIYFKSFAEDWVVSVVGVFLAIVFIRRRKRFDEKKKQYTVEWFVKKYNGKEKNEND